MNILLINHYAGSPCHEMNHRPFYLSRKWVRAEQPMFSSGVLEPTFRTPLTPGGNIAPPSRGAPPARDGA